MKGRKFLLFAIALFTLLIGIRSAQFLMLKFLHWDLNLLETVSVPLTLLSSFAVGMMIANRRSE